MEQTRLAASVLLVLFVILILFFSDRVQKEHIPILRPIPAFDVLKMLVARAIEAGSTLHFSLGTGGIANQTTADTLAGLTVLDYVLDQTAAAGVSPIVTVADPALMVLAQDRLRQAHQADYGGTTDISTEVRWLSTNPAAYAAGVMDILDIENLEGNIMLGHFGDEYLLIGELANRKRPAIMTVAGVSDPNILPYVYATSPQGLWAEEMFAAGAYLTKKPIHIGSLLAQDTIRWVISSVILGGVLLKAFGILG